MKLFSQLKQEPGPENPIFLPTDAKYDWLLAKIWVRSSDFHVHQTVTHLLRTHLISEVFGIAMYRQLAAVHPLFKVSPPSGLEPPLYNVIYLLLGHLHPLLMNHTNLP